MVGFMRLVLAVLVGIGLAVGAFVVFGKKDTTAPGT